MTVLAWDGNELAVDSQITYGGVVDLRGIKYNHTPRGIAAICGSIPAGQHFFHVLNKGGDLKDVDFSELTGVIVVGRRRLEVYNHWLPEMVTAHYWAGGTGMEVALGAMHAGATATAAAKIAAKLLNSCGGKIHTFKAG